MFEDARLAHFSNRSLIVANRLFGDRVLATAPPSAGQFFLSGNALDRVTVTKATMAVTSQPGAGYVARFGMRGSLGLLAKPGFDLLSFERLALQNLAIEMRLTPADAQPPGGKTVFDRSFSFRTDGLVFEDLGLRQIDAGQAADTDENRVRTGSLLAAFPLRIKGFRSGAATAPPESPGYRVLHRPPPRACRRPIWMAGHGTRWPSS